MLNKFMKVAIAVFNNVIAPRADIANEIYIYRFLNGQLIGKEILTIDGEDPYQYYFVLKERGVDTITMGSCPEHILNILAATGVEIYTNVMGDPDKTALEIISGKYGQNPVSEKDTHLNNKLN